MKTIGIILIAVAAIVILAIVYFAVLSPKRRAEKRLIAEREQAASRHRELADERHSHASVAEQRAEEAKVEARRAEQEAVLAREEAGAHEGRADLHDQGLADDELVPDTASPEQPTTAIDRPDRLSEREGRFRRETESEPQPRR